MIAACPLPEQTYWVSNHEARSKTVTLAALHESVGGTEAVSLAKFTQSAGVSYHAIADNEKLVYTVPRSRTAWHIRNGNSRADGLCLCTPVAGYTRAQWLGSQLNKVKVAGWWLALVCADRGLDVEQCSYADIRAALAGDRSVGGTTTHNDYTQATHDGTHTDPRNFPVDVAIQYARHYGGDAPDPPPAPPRPTSPRAVGTDLVDNIVLTGKGNDTIGIDPPGARVIAEAYFSLLMISGPKGLEGTVTLYPQKPGGGTGPITKLRSRVRNDTSNTSDRDVTRIPDGTDQIDYEWSIPDGCKALLIPAFRAAS